MSILQITTDFSGQIDVEPRLIRIKTNDTQAMVTAVNYLQSAIGAGYSFNPTDMALVSVIDNVSDLYRVSIDADTITLIPYATSINAIHLTNWSGVWASDQPGSITYTKTSNTVTLIIPQVQSAGNNVQNNIFSTISLPTILRPAATFEDCRVVQLAGSGDRAFGLIQITTDGVINWGKDANFTAFDATTSSIGFMQTSITYLTAP